MGRGRFAAEPTPDELEQFFRLNGPGLEAAKAKRSAANRLGFAVLWGSVWMLGVFPTEDLAVVSGVVVRFAADQLGVDSTERSGYGMRKQNRYRARRGDPRLLRLSRVRRG
ncbi:DUF4158 domain-containing protein [Streptomyces sp. NPDC093064]|uniref:DUF4158 domain-containing protein n=1 Tax=Streptomyces sp. NPDC093064 TaxID=3366020 RepID=UPI00381E3954